jgi:regulator of replication initiation timing
MDSIKSENQGFQDSLAILRDTNINGARLIEEREHLTMTISDLRESLAKATQSQSESAQISQTLKTQLTDLKRENYTKAHQSAELSNSLLLKKDQ